MYMSSPFVLVSPTSISTMHDQFTNALRVTRHIYRLSLFIPFLFTERIRTDLSFDGLCSRYGSSNSHRRRPTQVCIPLGVSNGLCEYLRAVCLFLRARLVVNFFCEQRALKKIQMASSEHFRKMHMASSESSEHFHGTS